MRKALVVVSFGTTFKETREKDLEGVEQALQRAFLDRDFFRAYTSKIVMKRLLENDGIKVSDLEIVLNELCDKGYEDVLVQTTHITMGEEYAQKVMAVVHNFKGKFLKLSVGRPLLSDELDYSLVASALITQLPTVKPNETVVLMGHGSPRMHNPAYNILEKRLNNLGVPTVIGVVEEDDHPNFEDMLRLLKSKGSNKVLLIPLMLVCGDHAHNDMIGDDDDSWSNLLKHEGYEVRAQMCGMGRNNAVQNIYVIHALSALCF